VGGVPVHGPLSSLGVPSRNNITRGLQDFADAPLPSELAFFQGAAEEGKQLSHTPSRRSGSSQSSRKRMRNNIEMRRMN